MFFVFSKILTFLLMPIFWLFVLGLLYYFAKTNKWKKRWLAFLIITFLFFSNNFIYKSAVLAWQAAPSQTIHSGTYSAGILLGGYSMIDKNGQGFFSGSSDRFIQTTKLYHTGIIKKIIVAGGKGNLFTKEVLTEAAFTKKELVAQGIPDSVILIDTSSRNTYENAVNAKALAIENKLDPPYVLITSAIHMPRALKTFAKAGVAVVPHPANYFEIESADPWYKYFIPDAELLFKWFFLLKEITGMLVYSISGKA